MKPIFPIFTLFLSLSACVTAPEPAVLFDPSLDVTPGLNDKQPDTCHAGNFGYYIGKPLEELRIAVADKPLLVLAPGSLGSQEYNSARINAYVDGAGVVYQLSCG